MPRIFLLALLSIVLLASPVVAQDSRLNALTLEQRVGQMFIVTVYGEQLNSIGRDLVTRWQPGGVVLFANNAGTPESITELTNAFQQTSLDAGGLPMLIAIDQEGGVVARLTEGFTTLPAPLLITATGDEAMYEAYGRLVAEELKAVGINMNLAPVADLETNLNNPVIRRRSFGSDPEVTGAAVAGVVRGMQANGVLATVKHFPGHGDTAEDSHVSLPIIDLPRERLETVEVVPFKMAVDAGVEAVLVAHIWYPAIEPEQERPASLSRNIITGLLREQLGYNGLVMTDAMDMNAIDYNYSSAQAAVEAVKAGVDIVTLGPGSGLGDQEAAIQGVIDAVRSGEIPEERINQSVTRILDAKARYGILDWQPLDPAGASERVKLAEHEQIINDLFDAGVTVAYDRNDHLPLQPERKIAIAFLGSRAQIKNECEVYNPDIRWLGISDAPSSTEIAWAVEAANWADTMVVFTQNAVEIPEQQALVNALPQEKTVAVAIWSPYDWQTYPNVAAYVATYSPMRPAVPAACAVLFGAIPATGQLPIDLSAELPAGTRGE
jgi:beta-N-acetylhexosaminidase